MKWLGVVEIFLKKGVYDPQGTTVSRTLKERGYPVGGIRMGKTLSVEIEVEEKKEAEAYLEEICSQLLANPVIEDYKFRVEESS